MFDARLRPLIDPPLARLGGWLAQRRVSANSITLAGALFGLGAAAAIAFGSFLTALLLILASRLCDGLDGAVARVRGLTPLGGYLDIVADFLFYVAVPVGFALYDPANLLPALLLVASFTLTGISFLAYAVIAAEQGLKTSSHGAKSFFYSSGLAEGTETIILFMWMCLMPHWFVPLALGYALLCLVTVVQRSVLAMHSFGAGAAYAPPEKP